MQDTLLRMMCHYRPHAPRVAGRLSAFYRLAEHLLRSQLAATEQTVPNHVNKPANRPTMRWIFQCFEGIDLLHISSSSRRKT